MHPFMQRVAVTMAAGVGSGIALTVLVHQLIGVFAPSTYGDGQYVFLFFLLIPCSVAVGVLVSLFFSPPRTGLFSQLGAICVGGLLSVVLTALVLWLIVLVGVHVLGWR